MSALSLCTAAYLAPGRLPVVVSFLFVLLGRQHRGENFPKLHWFRREARRSAISLFLLSCLSVQKNAHALSSSAQETPSTLGGKPIYKAPPTEDPLRRRHPLLPVGLSLLAGSHQRATQ